METETPSLQPQADGLLEVDKATLDALCSQLKELLPQLDYRSRKQLLERMRKFITDRKLPEISGFDRAKAEQCRVEANLSRKALGDIVKVHEQTILKYEHGELIPLPEGLAKQYLNWLTSNGYKVDVEKIRRYHQTRRKGS